MFGKFKKALVGFAFAVALSAAGSVAPVEAKAPERPAAVTVVYCFYRALPSYYWTVYKSGTYCPPTNTYFIGGAFRTGSLYDRLIKVIP